MNRAHYSALDFQLLVELRLGFIEGALLPISTLRVLRARGWVKLPPIEEWAYVEAEGDDEALPPTDFAVTRLHLTPVGRREMMLFSTHFNDAAVYSTLIDDEGVDPDDADCDDDG